MLTARQKLLENGVGADGPPPGSLGVQEAIERSWRRSISQDAPHKVSANPVFSPSETRSEPLLNAAGRVLERWNDVFSDMRIAMFVTDRNGRIITRRVDDSSHARKLDKASAAEGFDFSEAALGTNGLGTALEERTAVFVRGAEHINDSLQSLCCAGAPIKDPISGRVIGSLALAASVSSSNPAMLSIAKQAASQIQDAMFDAEIPGELRSLFAHIAGGTSHQPAIVLSRAGILSTTSALPWFSTSSQVLLWDELETRDWTTQSHVVSLEGKPAMARRIKNLDGDSIYIVELIADTDRIPERQFSASVGDGPDFLDRLDGMAAQRGVVSIVGRPRSGKLFLSTKWLEMRDGRAPLALDAEEVRSSTLQRYVSESLQSGTSVVLRHVDSLHDDDARWLQAVMANVDTQRRARLVLTGSNVAMPSFLKPLIDRLACELTIPALRDDHKRIVAVAQEVASENGVRLSPEFLQALVRWDWPGEVLELTSLISRLARESGSETLTTESLPLEMRTKSRHLFGIAASEYQAIETALRQAKGNRSHAADALGIGRTTLYRKMRTYGLDGSGALNA